MNRFNAGYTPVKLLTKDDVLKTLQYQRLKCFVALNFLKFVDIFIEQ